jgi:hypothetical protein
MGQKMKHNIGGQNEEQFQMNQEISRVDRKPRAKTRYKRFGHLD